MVRPIGPATILLLQLLLFNIDPLIVVAVAVLVVVPGVCRLLLNSEPVSLPPTSPSLRLLSLLSPPLAVPGATAGPFVPLPVPAAAPPPAVPGPGALSPAASLSAPTPLPPVPAPAPVSPPVAVSVSLSTPVTTSVVSARVTDVHIGPALPCAAQPSACKCQHESQLCRLSLILTESPGQPALHGAASLHVHQHSPAVDLLTISMLIGSWNRLGQNKMKPINCPCNAGNFQPVTT